MERNKALEQVAKDLSQQLQDMLSSFNQEG
jgi:hypothetical protein